MINKILLAVFLISLLGTAYFYFFATPAGKPASKQETEAETVSIENKTYRNEDWGFQFEYPSDWEVRSPAFGSSISLFNLAIEPKENFQIKAMTLNITPKTWIEDALIKMENRGVQVQEITLFNLPALQLEDTNMGRESISFLILIDNEYWIDITGIKVHEKTLNQILDSFEFIEPQ